MKMKFTIESDFQSDRKERLSPLQWCLRMHLKITLMNFNAILVAVMQMKCDLLRFRMSWILVQCQFQIECKESDGF